MLHIRRKIATVRNSALCQTVLMGAAFDSYFSKPNTFLALHVILKMYVHVYIFCITSFNLNELHEISIVWTMLFTSHALTAQHLICSQRSISSAHSAAVRKPWSSLLFSRQKLGLKAWVTKTYHGSWYRQNQFSERSSQHKRFVVMRTLHNLDSIKSMCFIFFVIRPLFETTLFPKPFWCGPLLLPIFQNQTLHWLFIFFIFLSCAFLFLHNILWLERTAWDKYC